MKAAMRVNNPIRISRPVTNSINPAHQNGQVPMGTAGPVNSPVGVRVPTGHANNFCAPWTANNKPNTARNRLRTAGE